MPSSTCWSEWLRRFAARYLKRLSDSAERTGVHLLGFVVHGQNLKRTNKSRPRLRPGWALVRVHMAGICNTDLEILGGYHNFCRRAGQEFVGEVQEVGGVSAAVEKRWVGQRVTGEINIPCHALGFRPVCRFCKRSLTRHCERRKVLGIFAHDGAFAEYLTLPIENLHAIPDWISDEMAVFVEPLAAACEILDQVNIKRFREAAVLGDGKLAQLIARVLRTALPRVVMYGKHSEKLALARRARIETKLVLGDVSDLRRVKPNIAFPAHATASPPHLPLPPQFT